MRINKEMSMRCIVTIIGLNMMVILSSLVVGGCNNENDLKSNFKKFSGLEFDKETLNSWEYLDKYNGTSIAFLKQSDFPETCRKAISQFDDYLYAEAYVYSEEHMLNKVVFSFGDGLNWGNYKNSSSDQLRYRKRAEEIAAKFEKLLGVKFNCIEKDDSCRWESGNDDEGASVEIKWGLNPFYSEIKPSARVAVSIWNLKGCNLFIHKKQEEKEREDMKAFGLIPAINKGESVRFLDGVFNHKFGERVDGDNMDGDGNIMKITKLQTPFRLFNDICITGDPEDRSLFMIYALTVNVDRDSFEKELAFLKGVFGEPKERAELSNTAQWEINANGRDTIYVMLMYAADNNNALSLSFSQSSGVKRAKERMKMSTDATFGIIPASKEGSLASEVEGVMGFRFGCDVRKYRYHYEDDAIVAEFLEPGAATKTTLADYEKIQLFGSKTSGECFRIRVVFKCDSEIVAFAKGINLNLRIRKSLGISMESTGKGNNSYCGGNSSVILITSQEEDYAYLDFINIKRWRKENL